MENGSQYVVLVSYSIMVLGYGKGDDHDPFFLLSIRKQGKEGNTSLFEEKQNKNQIVPTQLKSNFLS